MQLVRENEALKFKRSNPLFIVAAKEFKDCLRSRWLQTACCLFALLAAAVIFGAGALGGEFRWQALPQLFNSLLTLSVFLVPLLALLLSFDAVVGEAEAGTLLLLLTYPLSRSQWLAGKLMGQGGALLLALLLGFGLPLGLLPLLAQEYRTVELPAALTLLLASAWLLGLVFMLLGYWISMQVKQKAQALALLMLLWLLLVLLYDLALLVLAVVAADNLGQESLQWLMLLNPASVFRLLNQSFLGLVIGGPTWPWLLGILFGWLLLLSWLCRYSFQRRPL
ncbi:ABC transporter permease subunit [Shewanella indica]|uniref:ABC transporter permease subunit n=1 Tax=Shewanella indica TaxID=768528 RepID=UPI00399B986D